MKQTRILVFVIISIFTLSLSLTGVSAKEEQSDSYQLQIGNVRIDSDNAFISLGCEGDGTKNNPYIVENYTVNGGSTGIFIEGTSKHFILRNCIISNTVNEGIMIQDIINGTGIIENNLLVNNNHFGILVWYSEGCEIRNNTIENNTNDGIRIENCNDGSLITGNIISNNGVGIGISTPNCVMKNNLLLTNNDYGISIRGDDNKIQGNYFIQNDQGNNQAADTGTDNIWDSNYWSDWDGEGSYSIWGLSNSKDFSPHIGEDTDEDLLINGIEPFYNTDPSNNDTDNDFLIDGEEIFVYKSDPRNNDTDSDTLLDGLEVNLYGTSPIRADTDSDGLTDGEEVNTYSTNPLNPDSDSDGLTDGEEVNLFSTNPLNNDTDSDLMVDGWEVTYGLNPLTDDSELDPDNDTLTNLQEYTNSTDPLNPDTDGDGLTDGDEVLNYPTDPLNSDTDGDGLTDGAEVNTYSTDPINPDTDEDGMDDGTEVSHGTDPLINNEGEDFDNDGLINSDEVYIYNTDPYSNDTDNDSMDDLWEVTYGLDPLLNDSSSDLDSDGLTNLEEYQNQTDPTNSDSDADGLTDGDEVNTYSTDPLNSDSDSDGLTDGDEVNTYLTDPNNSDTDSDGLNDYEEILIYFTDSLNSDTDSDGLTDGDEVLTYLTNPLDSDTDGDGEEDGMEVENDTDPLNAKSNLRNRKIIISLTISTGAIIVLISIFVTLLLIKKRQKKIISKLLIQWQNTLLEFEETNNLLNEIRETTGVEGIKKKVSVLKDLGIFSLKSKEIRRRVSLPLSRKIAQEKHRLKNKIKDFQRYLVEEKKQLRESIIEIRKIETEISLKSLEESSTNLQQSIEKAEEKRVETEKVEEQYTTFCKEFNEKYREHEEIQSLLKDLIKDKKIYVESDKEFKSVKLDIENFDKKIGLLQAVSFLRIAEENNNSLKEGYDKVQDGLKPVEELYHELKDTGMQHEEMKKIFEESVKILQTKQVEEKEITRINEREESVERELRKQTRVITSFYVGDILSRIKTAFTNRHKKIYEMKLEDRSLKTDEEEQSKLKEKYEQTINEYEKNISKLQELGEKEEELTILVEKRKKVGEDYENVVKHSMMQPINLAKEKGGELLKQGNQVYKILIEKQSEEGIAFYREYQEDWLKWKGITEKIILEKEEEESEIKEILADGKNELKEILENNKSKNKEIKRAKVFIDVLMNYKEIDLEKLANKLEFPEVQDLETWLLELSSSLSLRIDGEKLVIPKKASKDVMQSIDELIKKFSEWEETGKGKKK